MKENGGGGWGREVGSMNFLLQKGVGLIREEGGLFERRPGRGGGGGGAL